MTDSEYKAKINSIRSRYISALEKGIEGLEDAFDTLQDAQHNGKASDRIKAAETLITKVSTEIEHADKKEHQRQQLQTLGGPADSIPMDAAVAFLTKFAQALGADTSSMQNMKVPETREVNRISPTPTDSESSLPFHPPESERTEQGDKDQEAERKKQQKRRSDFLSTIDQGKGYKE